MPGLAAFAFVQPWLLLGLALLPAIWWLLRVTPPAPRRLLFPPMRLLQRLAAREETPSRTPWWLLLLRLVIAALLILGFARPVLNPQVTATGSGPLLLVVDDGWAAAPAWNRRMDVVADLLRRADRDGREVMLLRTAPGGTGPALQQTPAAELLGQLATWRPHPWPSDRAAAAAALDALPEDPAAIVWLSDGVATTAADAEAAAVLGDRLDRLGTPRVAVDPQAERALVLRPPAAGQSGLPVTAERVDAGPAREARVLAVGSRGEVLGHAQLTFPAGSRVGEALVELPAEQRNRVERLEIEGASSAGGVALVDERWRRRAVGLVGAVDAAEAQPLLAEAYFIERALRPFADIRAGTIGEILAQPVSMLVLPDLTRVADVDRAALQTWIEAGGVLVRFAGPRLARGEDDFVPVPLRTGDRRLGGALSWAEPLPLAGFPSDGPFAGLSIPADVTVSRQVLARPGPDLARATLATLADGTPLVTGIKQGDGWLVLVHTSANATWSTLPLSGLFVEMLRRLVALAPGVPGTLRGLVAADRVLDGEGRLARAPPGSPVAVEELLAGGPGPGRPPGFWGPATAPDDPAAGRVAMSTATGVEALQPIDAAFTGASVGNLAPGREVDLMPWLLAAALVLALIDLVVGLVLRGYLTLRPAAAASAALLVMLAAGPGRTQEDALDPKVADAALATRLGFIVTGDLELDQTSEAGLAGLGAVLDERTAIQTAEPAAIDLESDELNLYPLLYWPIRATQPEISDTARERLSDYLRNGGMLVVDTGDGGTLLPGQDEGGPGADRAAQVLAGLDLPPLVQVPPEHVLTRSFYLLQEFPGRWAGQPTWVDRVNPAVNDGVAGIVLGGNDWAGAWAVDQYGAPLLPSVPGGEVQREMARRFGVNLAMYALSGNYKTDQVHVPALLERLGQ